MGFKFVWKWFFPLKIILTHRNDIHKYYLNITRFPKIDLAQVLVLVCGYFHYLWKQQYCFVWIDISPDLQPA